MAYDPHQYAVDGLAGLPKFLRDILESANHITAYKPRDSGRDRLLAAAPPHTMRSFAGEGEETKLTIPGEHHEVFYPKNILKVLNFYALAHCSRIYIDRLDALYKRLSDQETRRWWPNSPPADCLLAALERDKNGEAELNKPNNIFNRFQEILHDGEVAQIDDVVHAMTGRHLHIERRHGVRDSKEVREERLQSALSAWKVKDNTARLAFFKTMQEQIKEHPSQVFRRVVCLGTGSLGKAGTAWARMAPMQIAFSIDLAQFLDVPLFLQDPIYDHVDEQVLERPEGWDGHQKIYIVGGWGLDRHEGIILAGDRHSLSVDFIGGDLMMCLFTMTGGRDGDRLPAAVLTDPLFVNPHDVPGDWRWDDVNNVYELTRHGGLLTVPDNESDKRLDNVCACAWASKPALDIDLIWQSEFDCYTERPASHFNFMAPDGRLLHEWAVDMRQQRIEHYYQGSDIEQALAKGHGLVVCKQKGTIKWASSPSYPTIHEDVKDLILFGVRADLLAMERRYPTSPGGEQE